MQKRLPLPVGTVLQGRYKIIGQLGAGGMGAVYEAYNERTSATVALKEAFASEDYLISAFEREAKLLANLDHEAFPRVTDYFAENDGYFLVMELIRGKDLAEILKENGKPFEVETVMNWADQILDALEDLHSQNVFHCDIKPANLKLNQRGKIKILDFGIAKGRAGDLTEIGTLVDGGSKKYAPLEQILKYDEEIFDLLSKSFPQKATDFKNLKIDETADLFALSATLYELLTNRLPDRSSLRAISVWSKQNDILIPIHQINPQVSLATSEILCQALELAPKDRIGKASEMRKLLEDLRRAENVQIHQAEIQNLKREAAEAKRREAEANAREIENQRQIESERRRQIEIERKRQADEHLKRVENLAPEPQPFVTSNLDAENKKMYWVIGGVAALFLFVVLPLAMIASYNQPVTPTTTNQPVNKSAANKAAPVSSNPATIKNSIGMEFVKIPSGSFDMGSNESENEKPIHPVTISKEFYIGKYEVTQAEWSMLMGNNPSNFKGDNLPVETVSWNDAQEFIKKLNEKNEGYEYRLPSEAEWEYAARAGRTTKYGFGDNESLLGDYAWYDENSGGKTHEVGTKKANDFGLHDMHGNVYEWCNDRYGEYPSGSVTDPAGSWFGWGRLNRGGSWRYSAWFLRSAFRSSFGQSAGIHNLGFRLAARLK